MILQILLPFTAPFPVCDLADILGGSGQTSHSGPASSTVLVAERAYAYAPPLTITGGRLKLVLVRSSRPNRDPAIGDGDGPIHCAPARLLPVFSG